MFKKIFIFIIISCSFGLHAQFRVQNHFDGGITQMTAGGFMSNSTFLDYTIQKTTFKIGTRLDIVNPIEDHHLISGFHFEIMQKLPVEKVEISFSLLFFSHFFSSWIHEHNTALSGALKTKHIELKTGIHFRMLYLPKGVGDLSESYDHRTIFELWNIMYHFKYFIKPIDSKWNVAVGISNMDYFVINQTSNPMGLLFGSFELNPQLRFFGEYRLFNAGVMNISANYFGSLFRTGVIWNID